MQAVNSTVPKTILQLFPHCDLVIIFLWLIAVKINSIIMLIQSYGGLFWVMNYLYFSSHA